MCTNIIKAGGENQKGVKGNFFVPWVYDLLLISVALLWYARMVQSKIMQCCNMRSEDKHCNDEKFHHNFDLNWSISSLASRQFPVRSIDTIKLFIEHFSFAFGFPEATTESLNDQWIYLFECCKKSETYVAGKAMYMESRGTIHWGLNFPCNLSKFSMFVHFYFARFSLLTPSSLCFLLAKFNFSLFSLRAKREKIGCEIMFFFRGRSQSWWTN